MKKGTLKLTPGFAGWEKETKHRELQARTCELTALVWVEGED